MFKWIFTLLLLAVITYWLNDTSLVSPSYRNNDANVKVLNHLGCDREPSNKLIATFVSNAQLLGGSAGVYSQNCGLIVTAFGYSDKGQEVEFELNTVTRIASITKPMTALAVMQLKEKGLLQLTDTLSKHLNTAPESHANITIGQLLNHTSGVPHYSSALDAMSFTQYPNLESAAEYIFHKGVQFAPGSGYEYSSFGYTLLGRVIEVVSKQSFEEYMRENIWSPAGMNHTALERVHYKADKSKLYLNVAGWFIKSPKTNLSIIYPAGGVESTAIDLLRFGQAVLESKIIQKESLAEMIDTTRSLSHIVGDNPYGFGWSVYHHKELGRIISHSGSQPGASSFFQILLDQGTVAVSLTNSYGSKSSVKQLTYDLESLVLHP
ncbi:serine hydrolase domain-containing protein [Alteromonas facilis]|uniref:serine hydrolase domain-containing protein n=1 Tax=Alteromonas facilis TaxID=2048004 RepID=UPI0013D90B04|nr:serine hydrolase domain-containing protein [Alteromonas facilis]